MTELQPNDRQIQNVKDVNGALAEVEDSGIKRDRYGRYLLPDHETGELLPFSRVTTVINALEDSTALWRWKARNIAFGLGRRADLMARAASVESLNTSSKELDEVIGLSEETAGASVKANLGIAMHAFTQRSDLGESVIENAPDEFKGSIEAYIETLAKFGMWPYENYIETTVVLPHLQLAGTLDRIMMGDDWQLPRIADIKTGSIKDKGGIFAAQLAAYAHAQFVWRNGRYEEMPLVDQMTGIIIHLPIGENRCDIYEVDLEQGWLGIKLASEIRTWRKQNCKTPLKLSAKKKNKVTSDASDQRDNDEQDEQANEINDAMHDRVFDERYKWIYARVEHIVNMQKTSLIKELARLWATIDVPTFKNGGPRSHEEIDRLVGIVDQVETFGQVPFPDVDPKLEEPKQLDLLGGPNE